MRFMAMGAAMLLAGCVPDAGADLAKCQLDRRQPFELSLCMRAKGFERTRAAPGCEPDWAVHQAKCYRAVGVAGWVDDAWQKIPSRK